MCEKSYSVPLSSFSGPEMDSAEPPAPEVVEGELVKGSVAHYH